MGRAPILLLTLSLLLPAQGCLSLLASLRCGQDSYPPTSPQTEECERIEEAAEDADEAVFDAMRTSMREGPVEALHLTGSVTDSGGPVAGVVVSLLLDGEVVLTTRTGEDGTYELQDLMEEGWCRDLALRLTHPDGRRSPPIAVGCGEQDVPFDFEAQG